MRLKEDVQAKELIENEWIQLFNEERDDLRAIAKEKIAEIQDKNRRTYNKKRKESMKYTDGDLVAIKRTQTGSSLRLRPKFLGPYRIIRTMLNNRYIVERVSNYVRARQSNSIDLFIYDFDSISTRLVMTLMTLAIRRLRKKEDD